MWDKGVKSLVPVLRRFGIPFSTAEASGQALAGMVTEPALERASGRYFEIGREVRSSEDSYDPEKARELWETSAGLVQLGAEDTLPRLLGAPRTQKP